MAERRVSAQNRLLTLAFLGVGVPLVALAAFGAYQTSHLGRFLSETSSEYGAYAAGLASQSLSDEIVRRVADASADARLSTSFGGASGQLLNLLQTGDPLLQNAFLIPGSEVARAAGEGPHPRASGSPVPVAAYVAAEDSLRGTLAAPVEVWRSVLATMYDTLYVVAPSAPHENPIVLVPLLGFQGSVVGVAGWRLHTEALRRADFERLLATRVFGDPRVYRADRMAKSLSLVVRDGSGREVFRSRPGSRQPLYAESRVGSSLPGWRVSVGPAAGSPHVWAQRFIAAAYLLLVMLVALCLVALWISLRRASEQVRLAEAKSAFLATVSHELKTPLALIRMAGETLELGRVRDEAERMRFLHIIGRECRRLTHMINYVLDFAKIEAGKKEFRFQPTDLKRIVDETLEVFEPQFQEQGFEVHVDVPRDLPPIEADAEALTRCVMNLVDNAVKYSRERRVLDVRVRVRPPGADGDRGEARIQVADRGIGIAARDRDRIFEKFARVEEGLVHDVKGSGLGLSLVQHIVEAHGGRVEVESTLGQGSTFTLVLPARQEPREAPSVDGGRRG